MHRLGRNVFLVKRDKWLTLESVSFCYLQKKKEEVRHMSPHREADPNFYTLLFQNICVK